MIEQLQELYTGNKMLLKSMKKVRKHVTDSTLLEIVEQGITNTDEQIMHIKRAFDMLYVKQKKGDADVFDALIFRLNDLVKISADPEVMDAAIVTALQHINHYKIAGYGAICTYAKMLDQHPLAALIHQNLDQEKTADKRLAIRAEEVVNRKAQEVTLP